MHESLLSLMAIYSMVTAPSGFDDPEVMAAVAEVARDASAMKKYANNPKVKAARDTSIAGAASVS